MSVSDWNRMFAEVRRVCAATEIDIEAVRNVARGLTADGMLAAGEQTGGAASAVRSVAVESGDRTALDVPPAPAASVPDNGLSTGGRTTPPDVGEVTSDRTPGLGGGIDSTDKRPAPAERPSVPDWKKGRKR